METGTHVMEYGDTLTIYSHKKDCKMLSLIYSGDHVIETQVHACCIRRFRTFLWFALWSMSGSAMRPLPESISNQDYRAIEPSSRAPIRSSCYTLYEDRIFAIHCAEKDNSWLSFAIDEKVKHHQLL